MEQAVLIEGAKRFGVPYNEMKPMGGFSNNVFHSNGKVLKFHPDSIYSLDSIASELDWIIYLYHSGVQVTPPIPSLNGNSIEKVEEDNGEVCFLIAFEEAKGQVVNVDNEQEWNVDFFFTWGKTLGRIHYLSKKYNPSYKVTRKSWNSSSLFTKGTNACVQIQEKWNKYIDRLNKLPRDSNDYGMIHNDLHHNNFYVQNGQMILFDFGDCEYSWFIYDIAIVLYHAIETIEEWKVEERNNFALKFLGSFLKGYYTENQLSHHWILELPFFLDYRQIYSYMYFSNFLSEDKKQNPKVKEKLCRMKERIVSGKSNVDLKLEYLSII
ncbi:Ser/Thr protein kinase RdoA involved in Cpx stress response, MazF antagonist [Oceanobacillus limi]|uniref:Ser/Thr protein kinase RdoA involved in Cpx stress response, MazF antagonist n=1 Tax=Oceanobacillus limi TaxID=930131 RepID=A0A1I0C492_9BACI|nr:phosphotransferase [Oceanobacillus limi]SET14261.1 Ser/Thr protein kinase RdoA involved in Cpx stress response, MazF antagonist [Oceanobacillus limi]